MKGGFCEMSTESSDIRSQQSIDSKLDGRLVWTKITIIYHHIFHQWGTWGPASQNNSNAATEVARELAVTSLEGSKSVSYKLMSCQELLRR